MADAGWQFDGWSGDLNGRDTMVDLTMNANKTVTANFSRIPPVLTVSVQGNGTVTPDSGTYVHGETISMSAVADAGWRFDGWSGDLSGDASPVNLTMDDDKSVMATFSQIPTSPNTAPEALIDDGSTMMGVAVAIDVLANDTDADDDELTITAVTQSENGTVTQDGTKVIFTPKLGFRGTARFTYTASDGRGGSDMATVIVAVAQEITVIGVAEDEATTHSFEYLIKTKEGNATREERASKRSVQTTVSVLPGTIEQAGNISDTFALQFAWLQKFAEEDEADPQEEAIPDGLESSSMRFVIDAMVSNVLDPDYDFAKSISITLDYDEKLLGNLIESTLLVRYWDIYVEEWRDDGIRIVEHDIANNRIVIEIWHLTEFAIFGQPAAPTALDKLEEPTLDVMPEIFLPMVQ